MNGDGSTLNNWTGVVADLGGTASGILAALRRQPNTPALAPAQAKAPWGMIAAIGAGVVLLVVVLLSLGGSNK